MITSSVALVRARTLIGFHALVTELGGDPVALLARAGLPIDAESTPDLGIPVAGFAQALTLAADTLDCPDFGVRLAARQDLTVLGTIALVAMNSETVGEAIIGIARNMPYHCPSLQCALQAGDGESAEVRIELDPPVAEPDQLQMAEYLLLDATNMLRAFSQEDGRDWQVHLTHAPTLTLEAYEQAFGCAVLFDDRSDRICFPKHLLSIRSRSANAALREAAERFVRAVSRRHPLDLGRQIEELVSKRPADPH